MSDDCKKAAAYMRVASAARQVAEDFGAHGQGGTMLPSLREMARALHDLDVAIGSAHGTKPCWVCGGAMGREPPCPNCELARREALGIGKDAR